MTMRKNVHKVFRWLGYSVKKYNSTDHSARENYFRYNELYKKYRAFTMIPELSFHDNLLLAERFSHVRGAIVECGVWRGGMIAAMAELCGNNKAYFLFDSFEGLPKAQQIDGKDAIKWQGNSQGEHYFDNCSAEISYAREAMTLAGVSNVSIVKGWFNETLIKSDVQQISLLRLDGDWYQSTMDCLTVFYSKVVSGGVIIIDDYYFWEGCSKAVHDFLSEIGSGDRIHQTANGVAYIIKDENINRPW